MLEYPFKKLEGLRPFFKTFLHRTPPVDPYEVQDVTALCILCFSWSWTHNFQKKCVICFNGSPLKMMKNAIYFNLKTFFIFKIFNFLPWLFVRVYGTSFRPKVEICFHVEQSRFSCWTVEIFLLNGRNFHVERSVAKTAWLERSG